MPLRLLRLRLPLRLFLPLLFVAAQPRPRVVCEASLVGVAMIYQCQIFPVPICCTLANLDILSMLAIL
jgi:hypothetical protein